MIIRHNKRITCVVGALLAAYGFIFVYLYRIQIYQKDLYCTLGKQQYEFFVHKMPERGIIFDRYGTPLAWNKQGMSAFITPHLVKDRERLYDFLKCYFPHVLIQLEAHPDRKFMYIKRRLSPEELQKISEHALPDIHIIQEPSRYYASSAVQSVTGITDIDNQGICGIEYAYNTFLHGTPMSMLIEKDARAGHFYIKKRITTHSQPGKNVQLTIDNILQSITYDTVEEVAKEFNVDHADALIIDPMTGEILALVTLSHGDVSTVNTLDMLKNRVVTDCHEFGSVMKIFTALAALEEQCVSFDEEINCRNALTSTVHGRTINTIRAHGILPFHSVIAKSNNIGTVQIAYRLGTRLYEHFRRLGFGTSSCISLPGEAAGYITPPEQWSKQSLFSLSYGYEIAVPLIQIARAYCLIAADGIPIQLHLVDPGTHMQLEQPLYKKENIEYIKQIMTEVAQSSYLIPRNCTAHTMPRIMWKTGTAHVLVDGKYDKTHRIFTCAGIIEHESYRRVIITSIKAYEPKGLTAAAIAAPLWWNIAQHLICKDCIIKSRI